MTVTVDFLITQEEIDRIHGAALLAKEKAKGNLSEWGENKLKVHLDILRAGQRLSNHRIGLNGDLPDYVEEIFLLGQQLGRVTRVV